MEAGQSIPFPRLYGELASWWPILSAPEDYEEEADLFRQIFLEAMVPPPRTILELGSGGGNNASHLKRHFQLVLVDRSPGMLQVSRALNPECQHIEGDMRTIRLDRTFDAVFVHDAIVYMTTVADLGMAIRTAFVHTRPGGAALFVPDHTRESFVPSTRHGGHDGRGRSLRYLEWTRGLEPGESTYVSEMVYLLAEDGNPPRCVFDRHVCGLFGREEWLRQLETAGYAARAIADTRCQDTDRAAEMFLGLRPR